MWRFENMRLQNVASEEFRRKWNKRQGLEEIDPKLTSFDDRQKNVDFNFRTKVDERCETLLLICRQFWNVDNVVASVDEETDE